MARRKQVGADQSAQTVVLDEKEKKRSDVSGSAFLSQVAKLKTALETQPAQAIAAGATGAQAVQVFPKKKGFAGFKARLLFNLEGVNIDTEVRFEKLTSKELDDKRVIIHKTGSGVIVQNKPTPYKWGWFDDTGKEFPDTDIHHFELKPDGSESEVAPFERSDKIEIVKTIDITEVDSFLVESEYEVWSDNPGALRTVIERLAGVDKAGVCKFSFGRGFTEFWGLVYGRKKNGEFGVSLALTKMRKHYQHLMPENGVSTDPQAGAGQKTTAKATSVLQEI